MCSHCSGDYQNPETTEAVCEECGHAIRMHSAKYGCEFERGDSETTGCAMGPCGCTEYQVSDGSVSTAEVYRRAGLSLPDHFQHALASAFAQLSVTNGALIQVRK